jgi:hypothetical protein
MAWLDVEEGLNEVVYCFGVVVEQEEGMYTCVVQSERFESVVLWFTAAPTAN